MNEITFLAMQINRYFENSNLPKCNRKCYRGYEQTFMLLKAQAEMIEYNTFLGKMSNFGHF